ncbi:serine/threonine-protein kinase [Rubinisphaera margarita]|uniref:serine/threonine-protein kinase n=1 Tax=Rubinisphaera margarita TaxID=2909586 RepID=UPI001EE859DA|nr:serine/threonine-protein kinase [Rubinisphaera margarita]MCG6158566.1 serine/threonine protein kinase [Rubinisphaera margarita]
MNTNAHLCPECQNPLPAEAPNAPCPICLMKLGLASWTARSQDADDRANAATRVTPGAFQAPGIAELQPWFPQYELLELLGKGGMGAVYKARQKTLDRLVAIKIINPTAAEDAAFAERFLREARSLAMMSHPNIVTVHDFGRTESKADSPLFYIVIEYVDGLNLRELMRAGEVSTAQALKIVLAICDALQYAHDHGVVHRDIKPENILVDRHGRVKIADFGLAKLTGITKQNITLTGAYEAMGTLHYMAPEQFERPLEVDHRADIYALGVTLYELLTGELPVGRFATPSQRVHVDIRFDEVVLKALEREPDRRYQNASDVKTAVESISKSQSLLVSSPSEETENAREVESGRDVAIFLIASVSLYFYARATENLQLWYPLFPLASALLIGTLQWTRQFRKRFRARSLSTGLLGMMIGVFAAEDIARFLAANLMSADRATGSDVVFVRASFLILAGWILTELVSVSRFSMAALVKPKDGLENSFPVPFTRSRFTSLWMQQPKSIRVLWHLLLAVGYIVCLATFFSFHGSRTSSLHEFQIGNPAPWLTHEVTPDRFHWSLHLGSSALVGLLGWLFLSLEHWLTGVEGEKQYSMHWNTVACGFLLTGSSGLGLLSLKLHWSVLSPEQTGQLPSGFVSLLSLVIAGVALMVWGLRAIQAEGKASDPAEGTPTSSEPVDGPFPPGMGPRYLAIALGGLISAAVCLAGIGLLLAGFLTDPASDARWAWFGAGGGTLIGGLGGAIGVWRTHRLVGGGRDPMNDSEWNALDSIFLLVLQLSGAAVLGGGLFWRELGYGAALTTVLLGTILGLNTGGFSVWRWSVRSSKQKGQSGDRLDPQLVMIAAGMLLGAVLAAGGLTLLVIGSLWQPGGEKMIGAWMGSGFGCFFGGMGAFIGCWNSYRHREGAIDLWEAPHRTWFDMLMAIDAALGLGTLIAALALPTTWSLEFRWSLGLIGVILLFQSSLFGLMRGLGYRSAMQTLDELHPDRPIESQ